MKKIILTILLFSFLVMPAIGLAATTLQAAPVVAPLTAVEIIINTLFGVLMLLAVLLVIYGAFNILAAAGDAGKMEKGKNAIIYAIAAVVIAVLARGLIDWVFRLFVPR